MDVFELTNADTSDEATSKHGFVSRSDRRSLDDNTKDEDRGHGKDAVLSRTVLGQEAGGEGTSP